MYAKRSPRRVPLLSPSTLLLGMEVVIPPSPQSTAKPPLSSTADVDKPLPHRPRQTSSVYSGGSGYTEIIESYMNWKVDEEPPLPISFQPQSYRDTLTGLLARRFAEPPSNLTSPLFISDRPKHSISIPPLRLTPDDSPALHAVEPNTVPSFTEFSRQLKNKKSNVSTISHLNVQHVPGAISHDTFWQPSMTGSPEVQPFVHDYQRQHLQGEISPRITDVVDPGLVPPPLNLNGSKKPIADQASVHDRNVQNISFLDDASQPSSRFSSTSSSSQASPASEDSFVVYTGVRESLKAMFRTKMGRRDIPAAEDRKRNVSLASTQPADIESEEQPAGRKFSWVSSRRTSLQQGVSSLLRKFSISDTSDSRRRSTRPSRGRQKQLAIPITPYQRYGSAVWHASQRKKRRQDRVERKPTQKTKKKSGQVSRATSTRNTNKQRDRHSAFPKPDEVVAAFQSGRNNLVGAIDETRRKLRRSASERRREALKKNIKFVGPTDLANVALVEPWI
jgi:hypothetical protein